MSRALIDNLAELHLIDVEAAGLGGLTAGRFSAAPGRRLERALAARTDLPGSGHGSGDGLPPSERPEPRRAAMLHQDYKLDNVMFARSIPRA
jgi:aminoglycoside phosphotransferase (APT) family kinase protein